MGLELNAWEERKENNKKKWVVSRLPFNKSDKSKGSLKQKNIFPNENQQPNKNRFGLLEL